MIETAYTKKYNLETRLSKVDDTNLEILKGIIDKIIDKMGPGRRYYGLTTYSKQIREYDEYKTIMSDSKVLNKHVIGYLIDINPKTSWKNCNCGGTGNWRIN